MGPVECTPATSPDSIGASCWEPARQAGRGREFGYAVGVQCLLIEGDAHARPGRRADYPSSVVSVSSNIRSHMGSVEPRLPEIINILAHRTYPPPIKRPPLMTDPTAHAIKALTIVAPNLDVAPQTPAEEEKFGIGRMAATH